MLVTVRLTVEAGFSFGQALAELEAWSEECAVPRWAERN